MAPGVWPPGATDAVRVQGTHLIPPPPGASTAITELQFGAAPDAAPPPPSGHGRAGTTSVPRASAPPDARTAGPAPGPTRGRPAVPSRHHRAARCIGRLSTPFPWPTPSDVALATRQITPIRRPGRRETSRPRHGPVAGHVSGTYPLMPASQASGVPPRGAALMRWFVARGGGAARCAGRRCGPGGAARHGASPVRAAPDRRPVGRQASRSSCSLMML